jgi:hypothetical protein
MSFFKASQIQYNHGFQMLNSFDVRVNRLLIPYSEKAHNFLLGTYAYCRLIFSNPHEM